MRVTQVFTHLQPLIAIVTNIDNDHLGTHDGDFERLKSSFVDFLHNLPFYGLAILCLDDADARRRHAARRPADHDLRAGGRRGRARRECAAQLACRPSLMSCAPARRRAAAPPPADRHLEPAGHPQCQQCAGRDRGGDRAGHRGCGHLRARSPRFQGIDRRLQHVGDVTMAAGTVTHRRRLRPSPDGNRGDAGSLAPGLSGTAPGAGVSAASLHAHARSHR